MNPTRRASRANPSAVLALALPILAGCEFERTTTSEGEVAQEPAAAATSSTPAEPAAAVAATASSIGDGTPILIRKADGTLVHGVFRGPPKLLETYSGGTWIVDEGATPRARALDLTAIQEADGAAPAGHPVLIRLEDGTLVHGVFRGPPKLLERYSGGTWIVDEKLSRAQRLVPAGG